MSSGSHLLLTQSACCKPGSSPPFLFGCNASPLICHDLPQHLCAGSPDAVSKPDAPLNVSCSNSSSSPSFGSHMGVSGSQRKSPKRRRGFLAAEGRPLPRLFRRRALNRTFCPAQRFQNSGDHGCLRSWEGAIQGSLRNWGHVWVCAPLSPPEAAPGSALSIRRLRPRAGGRRGARKVRVRRSATVSPAAPQPHGPSRDPPCVRSAAAACAAEHAGEGCENAAGSQALPRLGDPTSNQRPGLNCKGRFPKRSAQVAENAPFRKYLTLRKTSYFLRSFTFNGQTKNHMSAFLRKENNNSE